jgi:hypothetical protein
VRTSSRRVYAMTKAFCFFLGGGLVLSNIIKDLGGDRAFLFNIHGDIH